MVDGIAAVQARIGELRQLVEPQKVATTAPRRTAATTASRRPSSASFTDALAALGLSSTATPAATTTGPTGQSLIAAAEKYIGTPYVWGGESLSEGGLDCSGLVQRSLADIGVTGIPRTAREQMTLGTAVPSLDQALPGDLLVFNGGTHIAIYVGDGKMIDAPKPGGHVSVRDVYETPSAIRRVLPQETAAPAAAPVTAAATATASAQRAALEALIVDGSSRRPRAGSPPRRRSGRMTAVGVASVGAGARTSVACARPRRPPATSPRCCSRSPRRTAARCAPHARPAADTHARDAAAQRDLRPRRRQGASPPRSAEKARRRRRQAGREARRQGRRKPATAERTSRRTDAPGTTPRRAATTDRRRRAADATVRRRADARDRAAVAARLDRRVASRPSPSRRRLRGRPRRDRPAADAAQRRRGPAGAVAPVAGADDAVPTAAAGAQPVPRPQRRPRADRRRPLLSRHRPRRGSRRRPARLRRRDAAPTVGRSGGRTGRGAVAGPRRPPTPTTAPATTPTVTPIALPAVAATAGAGTGAGRGTRPGARGAERTHAAPPLAEQLGARLTALTGPGGLSHGRHILTVPVDPENLGPVRIVAHISADLGPRRARRLDRRVPRGAQGRARRPAQGPRRERAHGRRRLRRPAGPAPARAARPDGSCEGSGNRGSRDGSPSAATSGSRRP